MSESEGESASCGLPASATEALLKAGHLRSLPALSLLCEEGQVMTSFFVVKTGEFLIAKIIAGKLCPLSTSGPGGILALLSALDGEPCAVSMQALGDATVVEIERDNLFAILDPETTPDLTLAWKLSQVAIRRLRKVTDDLALALYRAVSSTKYPGLLDPVELARIQASNHVWSFS
jgi:CRP-like cAMP-binding protein